MTDNQEKTGRGIRLCTVCHDTGQSPATVWRRVKDDPTFPKPFKLSPGITVWDEDEIRAWIAAKKRQAHGERDPAQGEAKAA